jgi:hypothetical protein
MSLHQGRGPGGAFTRRSLAEESLCWENCVVKVPSVRIVDESAQNRADDEKNEVVTENNQSGRRRIQVVRRR